MGAMLEQGDPASNGRHTDVPKNHSAPVCFLPAR
jgi:hypothetical protein